MDIKSKVLINFIALITIFASCGKNCIDTSYSFSINASVYPDKDSIHIGDTLWLEVSTPTTLLDNISGKSIDYSGAANMGIAIQLASLHAASDTDAGISNATEEFDYIVKNGSLYTSDQNAMNYLYDEINNTYFFKIGIVAKQKGVYRLFPSDAVNVYRKNNKCNKATFHLSLKNTDQHFYFYKIVSSNAQPDDFAIKHYYCFKVY